MTWTFLLLALLACGPKDASIEAAGKASSARTEPADLAGEWELEGSSTAWTFTDDGSGTPEVSGVDLSDGEAFEITEVSFKDGVLRFQSRMPSTDHVLQQTWVMKDDGTFEVSVTGDADTTVRATRR